MNAIVPTAEKEIWLHTQIRREGNFMRLTGYLVAGTKTEVFDLRADIRPYIALAMRLHQRLHAMQQGQVAGDLIGFADEFDDDEDEIGADVDDEDDDEIEVGDEIGRSRKARRKARRNRRKARRKARRARHPRRKLLGKITKRGVALAVLGPLGAAVPLSKKGRRKAKNTLKKIARTAKKIAKNKLVRTSTKIVARTAAVATLGPLGMVVPVSPKAVASMAKASATLGLVHAPKGRKLGSKLKKFAHKLKLKTKVKLSKIAKSKGLFKKHPLKKVALAIKKATAKIVKKKLGRILSKAPKLRKEIETTALGVGLAKNAIQKVIDQSKSNPKAFKARHILSAVALHHQRLEQIGKSRDQRGITGLVVNQQGRIERGRFLKLSTGGHANVILSTDGSIVPGQFQRISGDCVGADCGCVGGDCGDEWTGPVAGELSVGECIGCGPVAGEPSVGECVGCGPVYPLVPGVVAH